MKKKVTLILFLCLTVFASCRAQEAKKPLEGKWQAVTTQAGAAEKYLPDELEFFHDGTVIMAGFPAGKLPYKTELSAQEKELIRKNYPELKDKNILLVLLDPSEKDWNSAIAYEFMVKGDELTLRPVISDAPVKFRRVPPGKK